MMNFTKIKGVERFRKLLSIAGLETKPHQLEGVEWMLRRENNELLFDGIRGGINADEMGLGKTMMMIGTIVSNFKRRTLIVVPFALLEQWRSEVYRVTKHKPLIYHGVIKKNYDFETVSSAPIVLTTYGHVHYRIEGSILHKIKWDRIVFDEAHHLRNPKGKTYIGAKMLTASIRWLLTGTPIQNKMRDLHAILELLGFSSCFYKNKDILEQIIHEVILKRTKEQAGVILPRKFETIVKVEWNKDEKTLAQDVHSRLKFSGIVDSVTKYHMGYGRHALVTMLRARQVCVMPELIQSSILKSMKECDEGFEEIEDEEIMKMEKNELTKIMDKMEQICNAGALSKIRAVCEKIRKNRNNEKQKIVFCQFRREIDQFEKILKNYGFKTASIDGRTPKCLRDKYLKGKDLDILILQIQTGCEGLNLQTFSEVYFVTPHWNPAIEDQAIARCHRIGQKNEVEIYRFQMSEFEENTHNIETRARSIQNTKRKLYELFD